MNAAPNQPPAPKQMKTKQIMLRHASDDFWAVIIAQAMETAGAEVFSVVNNGLAEAHGFTPPNWKPPQKFIVFCKFEAPLTYDKIDEAISEAYDKQNNPR